MSVFLDRRAAGRELAERLQGFADDAAVVVVGLPRGGVPVAEEVAGSLAAPLDVIVVRKLGAPGNPELAMGAIGEDGVRVLNQIVIGQMGVTDAEIDQVESRERVELERRAQRFRQGRPRVPLSGRTVVLVDDGVATGSTMRAACAVARAEGAKRIVVAVPVAPAGWTDRFERIADQCVSLATPEHFMAVGQWYRNFDQTTDDEVVDCLRRSTQVRPAVVASGRDVAVEIRLDGLVLDGQLTVPPECNGLVVFVHGSGSSRLSPRNRFVASELTAAGMATLLFDLLTRDEEHDRANVFDIELLVRRLLAVTSWVKHQPDLAELPIGYFGASTGAAAALRAAAAAGAAISAVVSRGGRPDLALEWLAAVRSPTLLIVGSRDTVVLDLNRRAADHLQCEKSLRIVDGATHLFEEPGTLRAAAELARDWFVQHFDPTRAETPPAS
jgi:putative phosphoribosyl transferase